ncbi:SDR family oxidoreductase [Nostoc sp.]|uniref:SDR family oxidoreductase n=1 Tax=Nostoc sp. TaxID=1180 RepID=UPI002FFA2B8F
MNYPYFRTFLRKSCSGCIPSSLSKATQRRPSEGDFISNNIEGKVVVITGASSGLGEVTAWLLSAPCASVVLGAPRTDRLQSLADELIGSGGKALAVTTDVTHCSQVKRLVDTAVQNYGRIDVIINNAGLMPQSPLERLKIDEWN